MAHAAYDAIADWYEDEFLAASAGADPLGIREALGSLLGSGRGTCLEVGCGTGTHASQLRELGWAPVGVDLSSRMLARARGRLPIARADALRLPFRDRSVAAVVIVMAHTDLPDYPAVLREAARVLVLGGPLVHVGVHPCFCGGFADHTDPAAVVIRPGYRDVHWTRESYTDRGIRDKVGASHLPLPALLHAFHEAGLLPERYAEGGGPTPMTFSLRARRVARPTQLRQNCALR